MLGNRIRRVLSEERQREIYRFHLAKTMMKTFGYRPWMSKPNVYGANGERIIRRIQSNSCTAGMSFDKGGKDENYR